MGRPGPLSPDWLKILKVPLMLFKKLLFFLNKNSKDIAIGSFHWSLKMENAELQILETPFKK